MIGGKWAEVFVKGWIGIGRHLDMETGLIFKGGSVI